MADNPQPPGENDEQPVKVDVAGDVKGDLTVAQRVITNVSNVYQTPLRLLVVLGVVLLLGFAAITIFLPSLISFPQPFRDARRDEVLVIVTDFVGEGVAADTRIFSELQSRVQASDLQNVRVEHLESETPRSSAEAIAVGERFNATLVIWGIADTAGIQPNYEIIRNSDLIEARAEFSEVGAELPNFNAYVREDAQNEFEYLMLFSLGQMAYFVADNRQAADLFDEALAVELNEERLIDLNVPTAYAYYGEALIFLNDYDGAIEKLNTALEIDPESALAYNHRGYANFFLEDYETAIADLERALELDPSRALAHNDLGLIYRQLENFEASIEAFDNAIELDPDNPVFVDNRGLAHLDADNLEAALADFDRAIELDPDYAIYYYDRASTYDLLGNDEEAVLDYGEFLSFRDIDEDLAADAEQRIEELEAGR